MAHRRKQFLALSNSEPPKKIIRFYDDLPDELVESILSFLPAKKVTRLSILSKKYRYAWKLCRNFCFDKVFAKYLTRNEYKKILSDFFAHHSNSRIDKLQIFFDPTNDNDLVSDWVDEAIRLGTTELELDFSPASQPFFLDSIAIQSISILKLVNCDLDLKTIENGLPHLIEFTLQNVKTRVETVDFLFANCPRLKKLELIKCGSINAVNVWAYFLKGFKILVVKDCPNVYAINVNAPTLRSFHFSGKLCEFVFDVSVQNLDDVVLDIVPPRGFQLFPHRENMMITLKYVTVLTVTSTFLEGLCTRFDDNEYKEMDFCLFTLREFHLSVSGESFVNPCDIILFLRKCPFIESVFIDLGVNSFQNSLYWEFHGRKFMQDCTYLFSFIKHVKIKGFTLNDLPLKMAKFFLSHAINIESLVLVKAKNYVGNGIMIPLLIKLDASIPFGSAKIEVHEYMRDESDITPTHLI